MTTTWAWLVLLFPLLGVLAIGLGFKRYPRSAGAIATGAIAIAFVFAVLTLLSLLGHGSSHRELTSSLWNYAVSDGVDAKLGILIDPVSVFMMLVVTGISTLIHLYSIAYMRSDQGYARYFAYLNFFVLSMLILVMGGNFIVLIIGWGMVGAASYLLISFWYRRSTATRAGVEAFVINTVGDVGLILGAILILRHTHTVGFLGTFAALPQAFHTDSTDLVVGSILILVGAFAKSAQIPMHTWLADAMEGPTPVSSLIHAATMVTAGVYLIVRLHPLFELAPTAAWVGVIVGCLTLLVAGTIGLVQTDIKRIIAYSTMSQIGYMIMGASAGAYSAAMFHLMAHAFFKALLFMAAGSVIGAMGGAQSIDKMSGLRKALPFTFLCFIVGGLALSGIAPFSGWFSKDQIIGYLMHRGGWYSFFAVMGYIGALITGLYTFRLIFRVFFGAPCEEATELEHGHLAHAEVPTNPANGEVEDTEIGFPGPEHVIAEREWTMKIAMSVLAIGAVVVGFLQMPGIDHVLSGFLDSSFAGSPRIAAGAEPSAGSEWIGLIAGTIVGLIGIGIVFVIYLKRPGTSAKLQARFSALHKFLLNKWYFEAAIDAVIVRPVLALGRLIDRFLEHGLVQGVLTGGFTDLVRAASAGVRRAQTGLLRNYAGLVALGIVGVGLYFLIAS